jgi:glycosyltransferase involved in cell wall biosynthesis
MRNEYIAWTPFGADLVSFPSRKPPKTLQTAGFVGHVDTNIDYESVKRPNMFASICRMSDIKPIYVYGQTPESPEGLYQGIDVLICCSVYESGPLGIFEAAAMGIPVLTTAVGNSKFIPRNTVLSDG